MTAYTRGGAYEVKCADQLRAEGYHVWLARGSKGPADLLAIKPGQLLLVQVKGARAAISHEGWNALYQLARDLGTVGKPCHAIVADWPLWKPSKAGPMRLRRITGPHILRKHAWPAEPFTTDQAVRPPTAFVTGLGPVPVDGPAVPLRPAQGDPWGYDEQDALPDPDW